MKKVIFAGLYFLCLTSVYASEIMSGADVMEAGSWRISVYGKHAEGDSTLEVSGPQAITVPTTGGSATIFSNSNTQVEMEKKYDSAIAALTFRPRDGLHYRFKMGQIRNFNLAYSSGSQVNELESQADGLEWGFGVRWNVSQNTLVSSAVSIDLSYTQKIVNLDRFKAGNTTSSVNQRYEEEEIQAAGTVSHRFKWAEPYGGIKVSRTRNRLKDRGTKEKIGGTDNHVSPFVGVEFSVFRKEAIVLEASFVDEEILSAGLNVSF